jgi:hypothetical protein
MPGLNQQFQNMIGGAGGTAINTLQATAAGAPGSPGSATDVSGLFKAIKAASAQTQKEGFGQIQSSFAAAGGGMSSDLMRSLSDYNVNYGAQLDSTLSNLEFQSTESAKNRQMAASMGLEETFGNAAMAFAPSGQVVGGAQNSNLGGALTSAGASIGSTLTMLAFMGFL